MGKGGGGVIGRAVDINTKAGVDEGHGIARLEDVGCWSELLCGEAHRGARVAVGEAIKVNGHLSDWRVGV